MVALKTIVDSPKLPTLPTVAARLIELRKDPNCTIEKLLETVRFDPSICARLLKLANSTYSALSTPVTSLKQTADLLEETVITSIALSFSLSERAASCEVLSEQYRRYWHQSIVQAVAMDLLSSRISDLSSDEAHQAGLLMNIGHLAMLSTIPDDYLAVLEKSGQNQLPLHGVETQTLGFDSVQVGLELMKRWQLSDAFSTALQCCHAPCDELEAHRENPLVLMSAIAAAMGEFLCWEGETAARQRLELLSGRFYDFGETELNRLIDQTRERVDQTDLFASDEFDRLPPLTEIYAGATDQLATLVVRENVAHVHATGRMKMVVEANARLTQEAFHDPLTQTYNRRFLEEILRKESTHSCRSAEPIGVIFADIDHFKQINDNYGHLCGDHVLINIASLFRSLLRVSDTLARYGGEEFVVLATQPTEEGIHALAERLRFEVERADFFFEGEQINVTVSLGASIAIPSRTDVDLSVRLLAAADAAMYDSKQNGRNQVHIRSLINDSERRLIRRVAELRFSQWLIERGEINVASTSHALTKFDPKPIQIGDLALRLGYLDSVQVEFILGQQRHFDERFGVMAVRLGYLSEDQLVFLMALQQEDPVEFSNCLVRQGLIESERSRRLLNEYLLDSKSASSRVAVDA